MKEKDACPFSFSLFPHFPDFGVRCLVTALADGLERGGGLGSENPGTPPEHKAWALCRHRAKAATRRRTPKWMKDACPFPLFLACR
jgi:hypothetical protein